MVLQNPTLHSAAEVLNFTRKRGSTRKTQVQKDPGVSVIVKKRSRTFDLRQSENYGPST